ncbi:transmembrane protein 50A [Contarinia nasturtii]|uniref:transmembrane protein 50A n=1 Tax=Contarinia nasturtii TaxID=265458 RepID=UPI0012D4B0D8|nr:transmembrane protein 50A [Contarinia nasturtii]
MSIWDSLTSCFWFSPENQRNTFASILAGVLFFTGWWFLIDAISVHPEQTRVIHILLGIMGTISLVMVNSVTQAQISGDVTFNGGCLEARGARIWIFVGFLLGFAAIIAAVWAMIADFSNEKVSSWPGISVLLQNVFIFLGSIIFKFGRTEESY